MRELGIRRIKGPTALRLRRTEHLIGRHVEKLGVRIDETANEPRARDAIGLWSSPRHPLHQSSPRDCTLRR
jgi:hypothetical protein